MILTDGYILHKRAEKLYFPAPSHVSYAPGQWWRTYISAKYCIRYNTTYIWYVYDYINWAPTVLIYDGHNYTMYFRHDHKIIDSYLWYIIDNNCNNSEKKMRKWDFVALFRGYFSQ